jgi:H+/Cl- antiporter ClcA
MFNPGKILIITGVILVIAGLIFYFSGDKLNWFGNLPGDIRIGKGNTRFYFPVTTMILISIVLSGILWIIRKFF